MISTRLQRRRAAAARSIPLILGFCLVVGATAGAVTASAGATVVQDDFDRQVDQGWGTASSGQAYTAGSPERMKVTGGAGRVELPAGANAAAITEGVKLGDSYAKSIVSFEPLGDGASNGVSTSVLLRRKGLGHYYQARLRQLSAGRFGLTVQRHDRTSTATLAGETVVATGVAPGQKLSVEFVATGDAAVELKARAWTTGGSIPTWQVTGRDTSSSRLAEGSPGLRFHSSAGSGRTAALVHQFRASDISATTPVAGTTRHLSDDFSRRWTEGWGASTSGSLYTIGSPGRLSVDGSQGRAEVQPGKSAAAVAEGLTLADASIKADLTVATAQQGSGVTSSAIVRRSALGSYYEARLRHLASGALGLSIHRVSGSSTATLAAEKIVASSVPVDRPVTVEFSAAGDGSVDLKARAWITGSATPGWQVAATDASANRLRAAGAPGLKFAVPADGVTTGIRVDGLSTASSTAPAQPTPTTAPTTPAPTPTAPATTAPTAAPTTPAPVTPAAVGSLPVGQASYPVPAGAVYVAALGSRTGTGTKADPYGSFAFALEKATAGSTLVLRAGTYHENVLVERDLPGITVQNYPGEAVWFDGSKPVTNWVASGSRWVASGWTAIFDHRIMSGSTDETSRWVDPARPLASYPDQVWVGGKALTQVASESAVTAGKFYVDTTGKRLVIGDDPNGKAVRASALTRAIQIHAQDAVLRGFGVRRYATRKGDFAAVIAGVTGIELENMVVSENAWVGVAGWASGQRYRNVTVSQNAIMGWGGNNTNDLVIENSVFEGNNAQGFKPTPIAAGIKITRAKNVVLRNNVVADTSYAGGVWFDVSSSQLQVVGNSISGNAAGLMIELSEDAVVADNHIFGNTGTGVRVQASGSVDVWNNTIVQNPRPFAVWEDERLQEVPALAATIPWVVDDIGFHNNVVSMTGTNPCPILTQDESQELTGNEFGITSNNNAFHRPSAQAPANFACWANGIYQVKSFKSLQQFRDGTGNDKASTLTEGAAIVDATGQLNASTGAAAGTIAAGLPTAIATATGQRAGVRALGAFTGRRG